jgi:HEAT repeat protein
MNTKYTNPVDQLLKLGDVRKFDIWPDYLSLKISAEHIPDLITMSTDQELNIADLESTEVWAPVHAWRLLGLLQAEESVEPLMVLFEADDDWAGEELPEMYGLIGRNAISALSKYLSDPSKSITSLLEVIECVKGWTITGFPQMPE